MSRLGVSAGGAYVTVGADARQFNSELSKAASRGERFVSDLAALGSKLTGAGLLGGAFFGLAAKEFAKLDDELRAVSGISGASTQEFAALETTVRSLGATTSFTALQVAQAAKELARGGQTVADITATLPSVLDLARGTQTSLDVAAASVVRTLGQFNLGVEDSARVVDVLSKAANSGTFVLEDLGESMKFLGPIADTLNFSVEEISAAFSVLADAGLRGGIAGRQLRRALYELTNTEKQEKLADKLGINDLVNAEGDFGSFNSVVKKLAGSLNALQPAERVSVIEDVFGEGAAAVEALVKNVDELDGALLNIRTSAGYARELSEEIDGGLGGAFRLAISAVNDLQIAIGSALQGDLIAVLTAVRTNANEFGKWVAMNTDVIRTTLKVVAAVTALGASLIALKVATSTLRVFATAFGGTFSAMTSLLSLSVKLDGTLRRGLINTLNGRPFDTFNGSLKSVGANLAGLVSRVAGVTALGLAIRELVFAYAELKTAEADAVAANTQFDTQSALPDNYRDRLLAQQNGAAAKEDALPDANDVAGLQRVLGAIGELKDRSGEDLDVAASAVQKLEEQFGPLGITVDKTTKEIKGLDEAFARIAAIQVIKNAESQFTDLVNKMQELSKLRTEIANSDPDARFNRDFIDAGKQFDATKSRLRLLKTVAAEAREELNAMGAALASSIIEPEESFKTPFDEDAARKFAENAARRTDKLLLDRDQGSIGGRDLRDRVGEASNDLVRLQLNEQKTTNKLVEAIVDYLRKNPGIAVGI